MDNENNNNKRLKLIKEAQKKIDAEKTKELDFESIKLQVDEELKRWEL